MAGEAAYVAWHELEGSGLDCTCHTADWCDRMATSEDLKRLAARLDLPLHHQPREGYPLLVLDFDRTLIDGTPLDPPMVLRPHTESFLMEMHGHYDLAIWSKSASEWYVRISISIHATDFIDY